MLLFAVVASSIANPRPPARVTVRIVRAQTMTEKDWERSARKREIIRSENGRLLRIRLIEFE